MEEFCRNRVFKAQNAGMERLPAEFLKRQARGLGEAPGARQKTLAIELVAEKRVADVAQMGSDLMGSARFQTAFEESGPAWLIKSP
jgi:hypothetical protein